MKQKEKINWNLIALYAVVLAFVPLLVYKIGHHQKPAKIKSVKDNGYITPTTYPDTIAPITQHSEIPKPHQPAKDKFDNSAITSEHIFTLKDTTIRARRWYAEGMILHDSIGGFWEERK